MTRFDHNDKEKLTHLLKSAPQDFNFDQSGVKVRIFDHLHDHLLPDLSHHRVAIVLRYSTIAVCVVLLLSGSTLVYAATSTRPGDALFAVNKLGQQMFLSLPLSDTTKASYETRIVNSRLQDLNRIAQQPTSSQINLNVRTLETVQESDASISTAIMAVSKNESTLQATGQTQEALELNQDLNSLEVLAQKHEQTIQTIESHTTDMQLRDSLQKHLDNIHQIRMQVLSELHPKNTNSSAAPSNDGN